jgi:hypothetical protein
VVIELRNPFHCFFEGIKIMTIHKSAWIALFTDEGISPVNRNGPGCFGFNNFFGGITGGG